MASIQPEHSRAVRLASRETGRPEETLQQHLEGGYVHLSVDRDRPELATTAVLIAETLRRLPVTIAISPDGIPESTLDAAERAVAAIDPERPLVAESHCPEEAFHVHLGNRNETSDIVAIPERHGAHLASGGGVFQATARASGLGIMTTSALVCGEVFKHVAAVRPSRALRHQRLSWCPVTLTSKPRSAPALAGNTRLALAIVGVGAIGTAVARILSMLPLHGKALLVDPERFSIENLGTYSLGNAHDAQHAVWKTELAAGALGRFESHLYSIPVEQLVEAVDAGEAPWPRTVLSGLDSAGARREVQRLWPDHLIDGATGDTMCGLHDVHIAEGACLRCLFPVRTEGPSSLERLSQATGLSRDVLRHGDQPLTDAHIASLPVALREKLRSEVGKPVCGLANAVGLTRLAEDDYRPSVSFVSQQAACLMVGRLLADISGIARAPRFVQYDALVGPQAHTGEDPRPTSGCFCQARSHIVDALREQRHAATLGA